MESSGRFVIGGIHAGPIPSPQTMAAYEQLLPGSANRILAMAESQLAHQQTIEADQLGVVKERMRWDAGSDLLGTTSALVVSTLLIAGGTYATVSGHPVAGSSTITTTIVTLAAIFVYGRRMGIPKHLVPALIAQHQHRSSEAGRAETPADPSHSTR